MKLGPIQTKWVEALPNYKRTTSFLMNDFEGKESVGYCCLGVYLEVSEENFDWEDYPGSEVLEEDDFKILGLRGCEGEFSQDISVEGRSYRSLAHLNDQPPRKNWTHADTAKFILEHTDEIFTHPA